MQGVKEEKGESGCAAVEKGGDDLAAVALEKATLEKIRLEKVKLEKITL